MTFVSLLLPGFKKLKFVQRIEHGKIDLYELDVHGSMANGSMFNRTSMSYYTAVTFYASKENGPLYDIKTNGLLAPVDVGRAARKKVLSDMLADNPSLLESFNKDGNYDFDAIKNAINLYNFDARN